MLYIRHCKGLAMVQNLDKRPDALKDNEMAFIHKLLCINPGYFILGYADPWQVWFWSIKTVQSNVYWFDLQCTPYCCSYLKSIKRSWLQNSISARLTLRSYSKFVNMRKKMYSYFYQPVKLRTNIFTSSHFSWFI